MQVKSSRCTHLPGANQRQLAGLAAGDEVRIEVLRWGLVSHRGAQSSEERSHETKPKSRDRRAAG